MTSMEKIFYFFKGYIYGYILPFIVYEMSNGCRNMLGHFYLLVEGLIEGKLTKNQKVVLAFFPIGFTLWFIPFHVRYILKSYIVELKENENYVRVPYYYIGGYITYLLGEQYIIYTPEYAAWDMFLLATSPFILTYFFFRMVYRNMLKVDFEPLQTHEVFCDAAEINQYSFQDPATPVMESIINLHDHIFFLLIVIFVGVMWMLGVIFKFFANDKIKFAHKYLVHGTAIEIIWTLTPALILVTIALPSFKLLYMMDEVVDPGLTFKAIGHQWYWSYEFSDYVNDNFEAINFDSYMVPTDDLIKGDLRLLEVDNRIILPINTPIRVIVTAADVLHAWSVPSLGVKLDAVPGRLNQTSMFIKREGLYYGQCSELCGVQHGFMPIVIKSVSIQKFFSNLLEVIENYKK